MRRMMPRPRRYQDVRVSRRRLYRDVQKTPQDRLETETYVRDWDCNPGLQQCPWNFRRPKQCHLGLCGTTNDQTKNQEGGYIKSVIY